MAVVTTTTIAFVVVVFFGLNLSLLINFPESEGQLTEKDAIFIGFDFYQLHGLLP